MCDFRCFTAYLESFRFSFSIDSSETDIVYGSGSDGMVRGIVVSEVAVRQSNLLFAHAKIRERYTFY